MIDGREIAEPGIIETASVQPLAQRVTTQVAGLRAAIAEFLR